MPGAFEIKIRTSETSRGDELSRTLEVTKPFTEIPPLLGTSLPLQDSFRRFHEADSVANRHFDNFLKIGENNLGNDPQFAPVPHHFSPRRNFLQELYQRWKQGPTGFLLMGFGFLLGSGTPPRYFEAERGYEIPMKKGDVPFRIGGGEMDPALQADLYLPNRPHLDRLHVELLRKGDDLVMHNLFSQSGVWIWRNQNWEKMQTDEKWTLREGECFVVDPLRDSEIPEAERKNFKAAAFRVEFGEGVNSFRLVPLNYYSDRGIFPPPLGFRLFPVFRKNPLSHSSPRLTWAERWGLLTKEGVEYVEWLWRIAERMEKSGFPREARERYEAAVSFAEKEQTKVRHRNPETRALAGEIYPLLGKALYFLGRYWDLRRNFDFAHDYYERALKYFDGAAPLNAEARRVWRQAGKGLFRLHRFEGQFLRDLGNFSLAGKHYEMAADYASFETDSEASAEEYLKKAAAAYSWASSDEAEARDRVLKKIKELDTRWGGPFR